VCCVFVADEDAIGEKTVVDTSMKPIKESNNEMEDDDEGNWADEDEADEGWRYNSVVYLVDGEHYRRRGWC
jgi:hypothetical protein